MKDAYVVTTNYVSYTPGRWCAGCGRKRTPDGRCPNCDAWWASPLVQVGGPVLLAGLFLTALGVSTLRSQNAAVRPTALLTAPPPLRAAALVAPLPGPAPIALAAPPEKAPLPAPARPSLHQGEAAAQRAAQVRLRRLSSYVDAVIAADDAAREAGGRAAVGAAVQQNVPKAMAAPR